MLVPFACRCSAVLTIAGLLLTLPLRCNAEKTERSVKEKTPHPCREKYDAETISSSAAKHLDGYACGHDRPQLVLLLGGSGAGKTTFLKHVDKHGFGSDTFVRHGLDEYLDYLPEYQKTVADTSFVYKDAADACYGGGAIPIAKAAQELIIDRRCHLIYEETGKNLDRILTRVLPPFTKAGFSVTIALVDSLPKIAIERAAGRFQKEGRYAPDDYIEGSFKNVYENYLTLRENDSVKGAVYCDNSCLNVGGNPAARTPGSCLRCWDHTLSGEASVIPAAALLKGAIEFMPPHMPPHQPLPPPPTQEL